MSNTVMKRFEVCKVDDSLGMVFGYAIVCTEAGKDYVDLQDERIPEEAMMKAAIDFARSSRQAREMHQTDDGDAVFIFPMTAEVAKALGITIVKSGLIAALAPKNPATLAKIRSGEYTGFSIGGEYVTVEVEEVEA